MTMPMARLLQPLPIPIEGPSYELALTVKIESPSGWLYLEDPDSGYSLHADTRKERQVTHRKQSTNNSWTKGDFDVTSVQADVLETVAVWVDGDTAFEFDARMDALEAAFNQLSYRIMWRLDDSVEYWSCKSADYSIMTQREFLHATTGYITARVPRHPVVSRGLATVDDT